MNESTTPNDVPVRNPILNLAASQPNAGDVSPLEQEVLDEYARLLKNMNHVRYRSRTHELVELFSL